MRDELRSIDIRPIGVVHNQLTDRPDEGWREIISIIKLDEGLAPALKDLGEFSHVLVLFWLDKVSSEARGLLKTHPRGRSDLPEVGVLATRSPHRPNPIGVTICQLLSVSGTTLEVKGLDAFNGTPVLDVKGWSPYSAPSDARVPQWIEKLLQGSS